MNTTSMVTKPAPPAPSNLWSKAWQAIAHSRLWLFSVIAIASASSLVYPHPPLVGFAAVTGTTLHRKQAVMAAMSIWFANQLYGFTIRQYPRTLEALTWGLVMGLGTLVVTLLATIKPKFSQRNFTGHWLWFGAAVIAGYVLFEGTILLTAQLMGGHGLTVSILGRIFVKNAVWGIALGLIHSVLTWNAIKFSEKYRGALRYANTPYE